MPSEIHLAFAHPAERADATATRGILDRISVRDYLVEVEIGAFQAERGVTQRIRFNIVVEVQPLEGPIADDVDRILSYDKVTEAIDAELAEDRLNLLETLAERVADRILAEPQAVRVFVRIEKLDRGPGALGVEIVRTQDTTAGADVVSETAPPRILYLSSEMLDTLHLATWLDQLAASSAPVIISVGAKNLPRPTASHPLAQRRIDLLSLEQNAWVLAARDARCKVVATRTELDWAMRNDQICLWAPSKLVLDAVDGPSADANDGLGLTLWLASILEAEQVILVGAAVPDGPSPCPIVVHNPAKADLLTA